MCTPGLFMTNLYTLLLELKAVALSVRVWGTVQLCFESNCHGPRVFPALTAFDGEYRALGSCVLQSCGF